MKNYFKSQLKKLGMLLTSGLALSSTLQAELIVLNEDVELQAMRYRAVNFLQGATMGPTRKESVDLADRMLKIGIEGAIEEWLDEQMAMEIDRTHLDVVLAFQKSMNHVRQGDRGRIIFFNHAWISNAVQQKDQLRQRMTFAYSQIYPASIHHFGTGTNFTTNRAPAIFFDTLATHAFSNHDNLLQAITLNPLMGGWLTHAHNRKANANAGTLPDENYAREIMQLFSCGLFSRSSNGNIIIDSEGNPVENFTNEDVAEMAKIFTGLVTTTGNNGNTLSTASSPRLNGAWYQTPMAPIEDRHDRTRKTVMGNTFPAGVNTIPEIQSAIDMIVDHPSTAPHMTLRLLQRLTASNPSNGYVRRVANVWADTRGNMTHVLKAVFLDREYINNLVESVVVTPINNNRSLVSYKPVDKLSGKVRENPLKWTQLHRFFESRPQFPKANAGAFAMYLDGIGVPSRGAIGYFQPGWAPDVFGYYDWEHTDTLGPIGEHTEQTGELVTAPELELVPTTMVSDFAYADTIGSRGGVRAAGSFSHFVNVSGLAKAQRNYTFRQLIDELDTFLCHGKMSLELKEMIVDRYGSVGNSDTRLGYTIATIMSSSEYSVTY